MKKLFLMAVIAVFGISINYAQTGFEAGINVALPIGDAADVSTFSIGLDVAYLYEVSEKFDAGLASGFTNAFGDSFTEGEMEFDYDDIQFIPVAAAARYNFTEMIGANVSYTGISLDGGDWSTIGLGIDFSF